MKRSLLAIVGLSAVACSADIVSPGDANDIEAGVDGGLDSGVGEKTCGTTGQVARYTAELEGCVVHRGTISIEGFLQGLPNVGLLHALREVEEGLNIGLCFDLVELRGLERLERAGSFGVSEVPGLRDLSPLGSLREISRSVVLADLDELVSLRGLERLESIGARLWLTQLPKLETLDGLHRLRTLGQLRITDNEALRSLSGLSQLERVDGRVEIKRNPQLTQSEIDSLLGRVEVTGEIVVENNGP